MAFEGMSLERAIREIKSALGKNVHYDGTADSYVMGNLGVGTAPEERFHSVAAADFAGLFDYTSSDTVNKRNVVKVRHITSGDMDDEFGAALAFYHMDDAEVDNLVGSVGTRRNGADNTAYIEISVPLAGVFKRTLKIFTNGISVIQSTANVSDPPTDAELDAEFGTPAALGAGFMATVDDNSGDADVYIVWTSDTSWYYVKGTKAT